MREGGLPLPLAFQYLIFFDMKSWLAWSLVQELKSPTAESPTSIKYSSRTSHARKVQQKNLLHQKNPVAESSEYTFSFKDINDS